MYSLEYSGIFYMLVSYPRQHGLACWPPIVLLNYAKHSLNGAGRRPAPHPFLAILPSPKAIYFILIYPLYIECVYVMFCENM
jgi:hypothetical protein